MYFKARAKNVDYLMLLATTVFVRKMDGSYSTATTSSVVINLLIYVQFFNTTLIVGLSDP